MAKARSGKDTSTPITLPVTIQPPQASTVYLCGDATAVHVEQPNNTIIQKGWQTINNVDLAKDGATPPARTRSVAFPKPKRGPCHFQPKT